MKIESSLLLLILWAFAAVLIPEIRSGGVSTPSVCVMNTTRAEPGSNCTNFQVCDANGTYISSACPTSLLFNEDMGWCDFPINVNSTTCRNGTTVLYSGVCAMGSTRPAPGTNCTEYETCLDGAYGFARACPLGTLWNIETASCDYQENVNNITDCTSVNSSAVICSAGTGYAVIADKCRTYQICLTDYELSPPLECPTDMGFADDEQSCLTKKLISNRDCTVRTTFECSEGAYNATTNCLGFITCISPGVWNLVEQPCPDGTLFAYNNTQCEYTADVDSSTCLLL